jgi:Kinesin motor domain
MLQHSINDVFERIQASPNYRFFVTLSMYQIRQEYVTDLLSPVLDQSIEIVDHPVFGSYAKDVSEIVAHDAEEANEFYNQGARVMNALSHRSLSAGKPHCIIDLRIEAQLNGKVNAPIRSGLLRFVSTTGSGGIAMESDASLQALRTSIEMLHAGNPVHSIPYASSVLTKLLKPTLGGNACACLIATINPLAAFEQDTAQTLSMVDISRGIENSPSVNKNMLNRTIAELREQIRTARGRLPLNQPGSFVNSVDPSHIAELKQLTEQLDKLKQQSWNERIKASQRHVEERKQRLRKVGLLGVLDEQIKLDPDLLKKYEKGRRNLVLQTFVVDQKEQDVHMLQQEYNHIAEEGIANGVDEAKLNEELAAKEEALQAAAQELEHHQEKMRKMRTNFAKYSSQVVEFEEKQRKTFLLAHESVEVQASLDGDDWRRISDSKLTDPKLAKKLNEIENDFHSAVDEVDQAFDGKDAVPAMDAKERSLHEVEVHHQMRAKLEEIRWERDQLLGRLLERDFRHGAQITRMQKQMFMVFREYRRHFEDQKQKLEARYRKVVEDAVQDALQLHHKNAKLEAQLKQSFQRLADNPLRPDTLRVKLPFELGTGAP